MVGGGREEGSGREGKNVYVESLMVSCAYLHWFYRERRLGSREMRAQWQHDLTSTR